VVLSCHPLKDHLATNGLFYVLAFISAKTFLSGKVFAPHNEVTHSYA